MRKKGIIFVISAPSGSGKTTLCNRLVRHDRNLVQSVSMTTRPPRIGERDKRDYWFITAKQFKKYLFQKRFLEWAKNFSFFYGTPRRFVEDSINKGKDVVLSIDVQGAMQIKKNCPGAVFIFITPPSLRELEHRLRKRNTEHTSTIQTRLKTARRELKYVPRYDYAVVNDSIKKAFGKIKAIITAERCRVK